MSNARIINWDEPTLPFGKSPSGAVPSINHLNMDIRMKAEWHWYNKGVLGILTVEVMENALDTWAAWQRKTDRREPMPDAVGKFYWEQTISAKDREKMVETGTPGDTAPGGKAN